VNKFIIVIALIGLTVSCSSDNDLAKINGETISKQQFEDYLEFKRINVRDKKHRDALVDQFLQNVALSAVVSQQSDFDKNKAEAEIEEFRRQMNISRYFEAYLKSAVTDQQIKNYYTANEDKYSEQKVHVAHVLVRLAKGMSETERKAKLTHVNEAYSKLKAGEKFEKIADDYSEDRVSAKKAGDLGWLKKGAVDPKFSEKIFSMKKDEVSEPFETSFGFHIVKLVDDVKVVKKPFEAIKGDIRYQLRQQAKEAELKKLKDTITIKKVNG